MLRRAARHPPPHVRLSFLLVQSHKRLLIDSPNTIVSNSRSPRNGILSRKSDFSQKKYTVFSEYSRGKTASPIIPQIVSITQSTVAPIAHHTNRHLRRTNCDSASETNLQSQKQAGRPNLLHNVCFYEFRFPQRSKPTTYACFPTGSSEQ